MRIRVIVHKAEEGGFWAEVPSISGCATQGESMEEIEANVREAIEGCLSVEVEKPLLQMDDQVMKAPPYRSLPLQLATGSPPHAFRKNAHSTGLSRDLLL